MRPNQVLEKRGRFERLSDVLEHWATIQATRTYTYGHGGPVSYGQMKEIADRVAHVLRGQAGLSGQASVAAVIRNQQYLAFLIWGCILGGHRLVFLALSRDESTVRELMNRAQALTLISDLPELADMAPSISFEELIRSERDSPALISADTFSTLRPHDSVFVFQTSGVTGDPKWVEVREEQILKALDCLSREGGTRHCADQTVYIVPPLSHSYGFSALLEYSLTGSSTFLPSTDSLLSPVGELQRTSVADHITAIEGVPYFYSQLARLLDRTELPHLKHLGTGGGAPDPTVMKRICQAFPDVSFSVRYGMTESPSVISQKIFRGSGLNNWKSSGRVLPIYDLRIVDGNGKDAVVGREGEIWVKGPCLALPYLGEPPDAQNDGFFSTGDLGYIDRSGDLVVSGRKSLYVTNRGFRISPEYIESAILGDVRVDDCRVLMIGPVLSAEIVVREIGLTASDILGALNARLPSYAIPQQVTFVSSIPRTSSGKVIRRRQ